MIEGFNIPDISLTDQKAIGIVLGSTGFTANVGSKFIASTQATTRAVVYHIAQQLNHYIGLLLAHYVVAFWRGFVQL